MPFKTYILSLTFATVVYNSDSCNGGKNNRITVIGIAQEDKGGAVVTTDEGVFYFLDKLDIWNDNIYGKRIRVTGRLNIEEIKENPYKGSDSVTPQQRNGPKMILKKPKWDLLE